MDRADAIPGLASVAVARSFGVGSWRIEGAEGRLDTRMTAVHPYVHWSRGRTSIWAIGGMGRGTAERSGNGRDGNAADLGIGLRLVEARRQVAGGGGGIQVGLRGEVSFARFATGASGDLDAGAYRTRAGVEASRSWSSGGGLSVEPFGRVSTRYDGGAGQTGVHLELEGGARVSGGILRIECRRERWPCTPRPATRSVAAA